MSWLVDVIAWTLVAFGALPVMTAIVLRKYRHSPSRSLRDRWHVAIVLAAVGVVAAALAGNRLFDLELHGEIVAVPLGVILLAVDVVSGKWLLDYLSGRFSEGRDWPETPIEREDREVGDTRRELQAKAADDEGAA